MDRINPNNKSEGLSLLVAEAGINVPPPIHTPKKMTTERRAQIINVLAVAIPKIAKARRDELKKKAQYTKLCLNDAFAGRLSNGLANNSKKSKFIYTVFVIQTSDFLFNLVMLTCAYHTLSIFFEPPNQCAESRWAMFMQLFVFLVYFVDFGLKMTYEGVHEYFSHDWQKIYAACAVMNLLDLCINGCTRWTNFMRPAAGILRARSGRRFFDVLKKMTPGMYESMIPISFFIFVTAVFSNVLFDSYIKDYRSVSLTSYNWFYLIFTNETYEKIFPEDMFTNIGYWLFFFPSVYIGQRFLLSLIIGDTYETFKSFTKKQLKKERMKEMQGLTKAFTSLDDSKSGMMSGVAWRECMLAYRPGIALEEIALYYELISGGSKNGISVLQFLSLSSVLAFKLQVSKTSPLSVVRRKIFNAVEPVVHAIWAPLRKLSAGLQPTSEKIVHNLETWNVFSYVNTADLIIFSCGLSDVSILGGGRASGVGLLMTPCLVVSAFYVSEFILRMNMLSFDVFKLQKGNNIVSTLFLVGTLITLFLTLENIFETLTGVTVLPSVYSHSISFSAPFSSIGGAEPYTLHLSLALHKVLLLGRTLRCLRTVNLNEDLGAFSAALLDVVPTLVETFIFTFLVTYIFGTMGNLMFGAWVEDWSTPLLAVNKAQQLSFMVGFIDSAEDAMSAVHPLAMIWFVFYLILSLTVANIALAIIINLHQTVLDAKSNGDRDAVKGRVDAVFRKCVEQARTRVIFSGSRSSLNFNNLSMSQLQNSSTRQFVGGGKKKGINLEELTKCAKYSNIDLIQTFKDSHRHHKDLNWELDFLKAVGESSDIQETTLPHGHVLFNNDEPSTKLYLLIRGHVLLKSSSPANNEFCFIEPTNFVGVEALRPGGVYKTTCVVQKEAVVMVFSQEDMAHKLDERLCGRIVRMAHKSQCQQVKAMQEAAQRSDTPTAYLRRTGSAVDRQNMKAAGMAAAMRRRSIQRTASERSTASIDSLNGLEVAATMASTIAEVEQINDTEISHNNDSSKQKDV